MTNVEKERKKRNYKNNSKIGITFGIIKRKNDKKRKNNSKNN